MLSQLFDTEDHAMEGVGLQFFDDDVPETSYIIKDNDRKNMAESGVPDITEITDLLNQRLGKIPHFILVIGQDTKIIFANDVARKALHVGAMGNIVGKSILKFTSENLDEYITKCFREKLTGVRLYVENAFPRAQSDMDLNELLVYYEKFNNTRLMLIVSFKKRALT